MNRSIRPIALGVVRRGREILVFDAYDSIKGERFHRPLGGGIEFGERAADAVLRELREETGSEARITGLLGVLENLYTNEGEHLHEIAFIFDAELLDRSLYGASELNFVETIAGEEEAVRAIWVDPSQLDAPLYPDGLLELLPPVDE